MKFYDFSLAPSPRRTRIFIAEKGLDIPTVQVNLREGEHFTPEFKAKNPHCTVPMLELDDGTCLGENLAICYYLEQIQPEPVLMGRDAVEQALVLQWNHWMEDDGFLAIAEAFRNSNERFQNRALTGPYDFAQISALAQRGKTRVEYFLSDLNQRLADRPYIVGENFTMADITALVMVDFATMVNFSIPDDYTHLKRWHDEVSQRSSAKA